MFKKLVVPAILLSSMALSAFAEEAQEKRNEMRSKITGESITAVSSCTLPVTRSYESSKLATNRKGEMITVPVTVYEAESRLTIQKCQKVTSYMVEVTGSMWNSKESVIQNSSSDAGRVESRTLEFPVSRSYRQNNSRNYDLADLTLGFLGSLYELEVMKQDAYNNCLSKERELTYAKVQMSATICGDSN